MRNCGSPRNGVVVLASGRTQGIAAPTVAAAGTLAAAERKTRSMRGSEGTASIAGIVRADVLTARAITRPAVPFGASCFVYVSANRDIDSAAVSDPQSALSDMRLSAVWLTKANRAGAVA